MSGLHFGAISDKCIFTHSDKQQGCHAVDLMMMCLSICMELFLGQFKKGMSYSRILSYQIAIDKKFI